MERKTTDNGQNTKRSPPAAPTTTTDFDIEYAKLIAKQFPIYD